MSGLCSLHSEGFYWDMHYGSKFCDGGTPSLPFSVLVLSGVVWSRTPFGTDLGESRS